MTPFSTLLGPSTNPCWAPNHLLWRNLFRPHCVTALHPTQDPKRNKSKPQPTLSSNGFTRCSPITSHPRHFMHNYQPIKLINQPLLHSTEPPSNNPRTLMSLIVLFIRKRTQSWSKKGLFLVKKMTIFKSFLTYFSLILVIFWLFLAIFWLFLAIFGPFLPFFDLFSIELQLKRVCKRWYNVSYSYHWVWPRNRGV